MPTVQQEFTSKLPIWISVNTKYLNDWPIDLLSTPIINTELCCQYKRKLDIKDCFTKPLSVPQVSS